jgi:hypothetical protein
VPTPDKHDNEPVVEISKDYYQLWREAQTNAKGWEQEAKRLRGILEESIGDAYAATVDGEKVVTYRPGNSYATVKLQEAYPDLTTHYMVRKYVTELDMTAFAAAHPEIAEQFRVRSFREV